jgi:hypothetical protein
MKFQTVTYHTEIKNIPAAQMAEVFYIFTPPRLIFRPADP